MDEVAIIAMYFSIDDILEREGIDPEVVIRYLIEEDFLDVREYLKEGTEMDE